MLEHGGGIRDRAGPIERILLGEPGDQRWIQVETGDEWNRIEDKLSNISAYRRERAHGR